MKTISKLENIITEIEQERKAELIEACIFTCSLISTGNGDYQEKNRQIKEVLDYYDCSHGLEPSDNETLKMFYKLVN